MNADDIKWLREQSEDAKEKSAGKDHTMFFYYLGRKDMANEAIIRGQDNREFKTGGKPLH